MFESEAIMSKSKIKEIRSEETAYAYVKEETRKLISQMYLLKSNKKLKRLENYVAPETCDINRRNIYIDKSGYQIYNISREWDEKLKGKVGKKTYEAASDVALLINNLFLLKDAMLTYEFLTLFPESKFAPIVAMSYRNCEDAIINNGEYIAYKICPKSKIYKLTYKDLEKTPSSTQNKINFYRQLCNDVSLFDLFFDKEKNDFIKKSQDSKLKYITAKNGEKYQKICINAPFISVVETFGLSQEYIEDNFKGKDGKKAILELLNNKDDFDKKTIKNLKDAVEPEMEKSK